MHTEACIGLDIAHFPSLMYGFIMQQMKNIPPALRIGISVYIYIYIIIASDYLIWLARPLQHKSHRALTGMV